jgi:hypothetical protein
MKLTVKRDPAVYEATGILLKNDKREYVTHALVTSDTLLTTNGGMLFKVPLEQDQEPGTYEVISRTKAAVTLLKTDEDIEFPGPMVDGSIFNTEGRSEITIETYGDAFFCGIIQVTMGVYNYKNILAVRNAMEGDVTLYYTSGKPSDMIILTNGPVIACVMPLRA